MKVVCAWCQRDGNAAVLGEQEPQDEMVSHGICDAHAAIVIAEVRRTRPAATVLERLAS